MSHSYRLIQTTAYTSNKIMEETYKMMEIEIKQNMKGRYQKVKDKLGKIKCQ